MHKLTSFSIGKLSKVKESTKVMGNLNSNVGGFLYEESIDVSKKDGWRINFKRNANDSFAFGGSLPNVLLTLLS